MLLQQVEAGTLALTDKLSKWYPDLPSADEVTVDMLAHSTSGYQQYTVVAEFQAAFYADPFRAWDIDDVVAYASTAPPPGTSWNFSDTNILILAQVLEQATGESMDALVKKGVFDPLGMEDTTPPRTAKLAAPVLHSYTGERGMWEEATNWDPSWTSFAGGWGSTQDDLRRMVEAVGTGKLVSKASHEAQSAPTSVGLGTNTGARYYGMGISVVNDWLAHRSGTAGLPRLARLPPRPEADRHHLLHADAGVRPHPPLDAAVRAAQRDPRPVAGGRPRLTAPTGRDPRSAAD